MRSNRIHLPLPLHDVSKGTWINLRNLCPVRRSDFLFTQRLTTIHTYQSSPSARRQFCSNCSSALLWDNATDFPDTVFVAVTTLDSSIAPPTQRHIHVSSRVPWYEIADRWPQSEFY